jgi:hypothetical protein
MPGLIHEPAYERSAARICETAPLLREVFEGVEWELVRAVDFVRYPVVGQDRHGDLHVYHVPATPAVPAVVVVFGFEPHGGETKIVLLDAKIAEPDDAEMPF